MQIIKNNVKNNKTHWFTQVHIFIIGISSNGSDDSPYSWTEKPFHPYTDRYKNAPVCKRSPQSEAATNIVICNKIFVLCICYKLHSQIYYGLCYRYVRYVYQPCQIKHYPISRHYAKRGNSYMSIEEITIPSFLLSVFKSLIYR